MSRPRGAQREGGREGRKEGSPVPGGRELLLRLAEAMMVITCHPSPVSRCPKHRQGKKDGDGTNRWRLDASEAVPQGVGAGGGRQHGRPEGLTLTRWSARGRGKALYIYIYARARVSCRSTAQHVRTVRGCGWMFSSGRGALGGWTVATVLDWPLASSSQATAPSPYLVSRHTLGGRRYPRGLTYYLGRAYKRLQRWHVRLRWSPGYAAF